jgi:hypothetical protein
MFYSVMKLNRTLRLGFALLLTLMLPLQGYAAMPACGQPVQSNIGVETDAAAPTAQQHCVREASTAHHHSCGNSCCGAVVATTAVQWAAPLPTSSEISFIELRFPPELALDRLDRPPRFILA